jgi:hypothetical protein
MKQWIADMIWSLIKDRVAALIESSNTQQQEAVRNLRRYAGSNRV